jgi:Flp pilus assembly pilin Flp
LHSRWNAELATRRLYSGADDVPLCAVISRSQCDRHFRNANQPNSDDEIGLIVRDRLKYFRFDQQGTTAVEFAIVAPVFIALLIGTLALCVGLFLIGSLHYAVEESARCASVKKTICTDAATTVAYAQAHYFGPDLSPTFTYNPAAACGNSVSASISYSMNVGFQTFTIPFSATACFP